MKYGRSQFETDPYQHMCYAIEWTKWSEAYDWCTEQFGPDWHQIDYRARWRYDGGLFYFKTDNEAFKFRMRFG